MSKSLCGLSGQLASYMAYKDWIAKGVLTADMVWKHQRGKNYGKRYLPETVGRALRSLEEQGVIAVKGDGISVQYKWIPHGLRTRYIPFSSRPDDRKEVLFRKV